MWSKRTILSRNIFSEKRKIRQKENGKCCKANLFIYVKVTAIRCKGFNFTSVCCEIVNLNWSILQTFCTHIAGIPCFGAPICICYVMLHKKYNILLCKLYTT